MRTLTDGRCEPLTSTPWSESRTRDCIQQILADTVNSFDVQKHWQIHPADISAERAGPLLPLYYGSAGVVWCLQHLGATGLTNQITPAWLAQLHEQTRATAQNNYPQFCNAYLLGTTGTAMLRHRLAPDTNTRTDLHNAIEDHIKLADNAGLAWGVAGATLAALLMFETTAEPNWHTLYLQGVRALTNSWQIYEGADCYLWTQHLYGHSDRLLGGLHGFAANAYALLRGRHLLPSATATDITAKIGQTMRATALAGNGQVNWPLTADQSKRPGAVNVLLQHCNGAPGIVSCLASLPPDDATDALFVAAGEWIWRAGPVNKPPSLCHGVPGNGFAFLKLYQRSGKPVWLQRARAFAMHAMEQNEHAVQQHGQRKYSLWTGDLGLACYLQACIDGHANLPLLDVF